MKDYLGWENQRNKQHAELFERMLKRAIPVLLHKHDVNVEVLTGHHITFELDEDGDGKLDISSMNEIPSADCLLFDHDIMHAVFGVHYRMVMHTLVELPAEEREALLDKYLTALETEGEAALEGA